MNFKKLFISVLILSHNCLSQDQKVAVQVPIQTKNEEAKKDYKKPLAILGSAAFLAGGCYLGKKYWTKIAWVSIKRFDLRIDSLASELTHKINGVKLDLKKFKVEILGALRKTERRLSGQIEKEFKQTNHKLASQDEILKSLEADSKDIKESLARLEKYFKNRDQL